MNDRRYVSLGGFIHPHIKQIIPADGWYAVYDGNTLEPKSDEPVKSPLICFALIREKPNVNSIHGLIRRIIRKILGKPLNLDRVVGIDTDDAAATGVADDTYGFLTLWKEGAEDDWETVVEHFLSSAQMKRSSGVQ